ncbi:MAG: hypothetical protein H8E05_00505 [Bacteroidetes bacterium]|nr:hypothetical protein [Bacteroidota bacterium]
MSEIKRPSYIVPYGNRKKFPRKIRDTEKKVQELKTKNEWKEVGHLQYILRNAWWAYKRFK